MRRNGASSVKAGGRTARPRSGARTRRWGLALLVSSLVLVACDPGEPTGSGAVVEAEPTEVATGRTPEEIRGQVVQAIVEKDADALQMLWPATSWDALGTGVLDGFVPSSDNGECDRPSETSRHCTIFEQGRPFVVGLTMELQDAAWRITAVSLDSTH